MDDKRRSEIEEVMDDIRGNLSDIGEILDQEIVEDLSVLYKDIAPTRTEVLPTDLSDSVLNLNKAYGMIESAITFLEAAKGEN